MLENLMNRESVAHYMPTARNSLVFVIGTDELQNNRPAYPNLYTALVGSRQIDTTMLPLLGKLVSLSPSDAGMIGQFVPPDGHPNASSEHGVMALPILPEVIDVLVEGNVVSDLDNVVYGFVERGVVTAITAFVLAGL